MNGQAFSRPSVGRPCGLSGRDSNQSHLARAYLRLRSEAHAPNCQFFTFPWGNPREAASDPKAQSSQLEALRRASMIAAQSQFVWRGHSCPRKSCKPSVKYRVLRIFVTDRSICIPRESASVAAFCADKNVRATQASHTNRPHEPGCAIISTAIEECCRITKKLAVQSSLHFASCFESSSIRRLEA